MSTYPFEHKASADRKVMTLDEIGAFVAAAKAAGAKGTDVPTSDVTTMKCRIKKLAVDIEVLQAQADDVR